MKFEAEMHMAMMTGGTRDGSWSITVSDKASGVCVLTVEMDPRTFAMLLGNRVLNANADIATPDALAKIGLRHDVITRDLARLDGDGPGWVRRHPVTRELEEDGWTLRPERSDEERASRPFFGAARAVFDRWVPQDHPLPMPDPAPQALRKSRRT